MVFNFLKEEQILFSKKLSKSKSILNDFPYKGYLILYLMVNNLNKNRNSYTKSINNFYLLLYFFHAFHEFFFQ